jgi:hypothetical protein
MASEGLKQGIEVASLEAIKALVYGKASISAFGECFRIVLIGESHRDLELEEQQREIIRLVGPEYVADEKLDDFIYDPASKKFRKKRGRMVDPVGDKLTPSLPNHLIPFANELGFKIVGSDLNDAEKEALAISFPELFPKEYRLNGNTLIRTLNGDYTTLTWEEINREPRMMAVRDKHEIGVALGLEGRSIKPVVQIVGASHGRNIVASGSLLGKDRGYIYIDQIPNWRGELFYRPRNF